MSEDLEVPRAELEKWKACARALATALRTRPTIISPKETLTFNAIEQFKALCGETKPVAPKVSLATVAEQALELLEDTFGNTTGDDWGNERAANVADALETALAQFQELEKEKP